MVTPLAQQLASLATPQSSLIVQRKTRPSLLFDRKEAALLDCDTVFKLGMDGFCDIVRLDASLVEFEAPLFSESAKSVQRAVLTREANERLDACIDRCLCRLSGHFLLKPAHKALEWLVYRFHIHQFNVDALMRCCLAHHDAPLFVRVIQLFDFSSPAARWRWLLPLQKPGVPLAKHTLYAQCARDIGLLKFICVMNKKIIKICGGHGPGVDTAVAFYVGCVSGCLRHVRRTASTSWPSEPQMALLLAHLLRGLRSHVVSLRAGTCVLVAQLCGGSGGGNGSGSDGGNCGSGGVGGACLSARLCDTLFVSLIKNMPGQLCRQYVCTLCVLAHTQRIKYAPAGAIVALCGHSRHAFVAALSQLSQRRSVVSLLLCVVRATISHTSANDDVTDVAPGDVIAPVVMATQLLDHTRLHSHAEQVAVISGLFSFYLECMSTAGDDVKRASGTDSDDTDTDHNTDSGHTTPGFIATSDDGERLLSRVRPLAALMHRRYPAAWDSASVSAATSSGNYCNHAVERHAATPGGHRGNYWLSALLASVEHELSSSELLVQLYHPQPQQRWLAAKNLLKSLRREQDVSVLSSQRVALYRETVLSVLSECSDRAVTLLLRTSIDTLTALVSADKLQQLLVDHLDGGDHSAHTHAQCAALLARLCSTALSRPLPCSVSVPACVALFTAVLPSAWRQDSPANMRLICAAISPELAKLMDTACVSPGASQLPPERQHRAYIAALLPAVTQSMTSSAPLDSVTSQLAERLVSARLAMTSRVAAAALCAAVIMEGVTVDAAEQVVNVLWQHAHLMRVKHAGTAISGDLQRLMTPADLLCAADLPTKQKYNVDAHHVDGVIVDDKDGAGVVLARAFFCVLSAIIDTARSKTDGCHGDRWWSLLVRLFCASSTGLASVKSRHRVFYQTIIASIVRARQPDAAPGSLLWPLSFLASVWTTQSTVAACSTSELASGQLAAVLSALVILRASGSTHLPFIVCEMNHNFLAPLLLALMSQHEQIRAAAVDICRLMSNMEGGRHSTAASANSTADAASASSLLPLIKHAATTAHAQLVLDRRALIECMRSAPVAHLSALLGCCIRPCVVDGGGIHNTHAGSAYLPEHIQCHLLRLLASSIHRLPSASVTAALSFSHPLLLATASDSPSDRQMGRLLTARLQLFTPATARWLCESCVFDTWSQALAQHAVVCCTFDGGDSSTDDRWVSPQSLLLDAMTAAFFQAISSIDVQRRVLCTLLDLCVDASNADTRTIVTKVLHALTSLDAHLLAAELQLLLPDSSVKTVKDARYATRSSRRLAAASGRLNSANSTPTTPSRQLSVTCTTSSSHSSTPHSCSVSSSSQRPSVAARVDQLRQWRRAAVVLDTVQALSQCVTASSPDNMRPRSAWLQAVAPLLSPLLQQLLAAQEHAAKYATDAATTEQDLSREIRSSLQLLVLSCMRAALQQCCDGDASDDAAGGRGAGVAVSVDVVVWCVRATDCVHTHRLALDILSAAARLQPECVLHSVMSVFTFMGTALVRQDNEFTFHAIYRTLDTVVPALLQSTNVWTSSQSSIDGASSAEQPAVSVLRVFCDAASHVPRHRRVPLFSRLLAALDSGGRGGGGSQLWRCVALLLSQPAATTTADATPGCVASSEACHKRAVCTNVSGQLAAGDELSDLAASLCSVASVPVQLVSCQRLIVLVHALLARAIAAGASDGDDVTMMSSDSDDDTDGVSRRNNSKNKGGVAIEAPSGGESFADVSKFCAQRDVSALCDSRAISDRQLRQFCQLCIAFVAQLLASEAFVAQNADLMMTTSADTSSLARVSADASQLQLSQQGYGLLLAAVVSLANSCSRCVGRALSPAQLKLSRVVLHNVNSVLDKLNLLLPVTMFVDVIGALVTNSGAAAATCGVRRKAIELLADKLRHQARGFQACHTAVLLHILQELTRLAAGDQTSSVDTVDRQVALYTIKLLARLLVLSEPHEFLPVLSAVVRVVDECVAHTAAAAAAATWSPLCCSALLCLAELCALLGVHALPSLPGVAAVVLAVCQQVDQQQLQQQQQHKKTSVSMLELSVVTAVYKLASSLAPFLSPYLATLLVHVCRLSHQRRGAAFVTIQHRLALTRECIASGVSLRVLLPTIDHCFDQLIKCATSADAGALGVLCRVLTQCVTSVPTTQLNDHSAALHNSLLRFLDCRRLLAGQSALSCSTDDVITIESVESDVMHLMTSLVPRLSENSFRPLFARVQQWAISGDDDSDENDINRGDDGNSLRVITFYRLAACLAELLRGLFVLFAAPFMEHMSRLLASLTDRRPDNDGGHYHDDRADDQHTDIQQFRRPQWTVTTDNVSVSCELLQYTLDCASRLCQYDCQAFINEQRFKQLSTPLVDQLENGLGGEQRRNGRLSRHLVPCIVNCLTAAGDDSRWKTAHYQILLKMRHQDTQVRLAALATVSALLERLKDDYMSVLPETVPFLGELLEDEVPAVEQACQQLVHKMEGILGESLQKYF